MILKRSLTLLFAIFITAAAANAQSAQITISLNEQFFDALLESMFQHSAPPEFPLAQNYLSLPETHTGFQFGSAYAPSEGHDECRQSIQLLRENNGVRTSVRFRDGKILAPIAFTGGYNPPLVGCVPFAGFAETSIDLQFDVVTQRLVANATVMNVNLNGTAGIGGELIARLVQRSIDKKINPIDIISLDKVSFDLPIQNAAGIKLQAAAIRSEVQNGLLNIHVAYNFIKP